MTTYYFNTSNDMQTKQKPKPIFTGYSPDSWKPVSPPLAKVEHCIPTPTHSHRTSTVPWLSLWSTSTWQADQNSLDQQQSSPINFDFLSDSPTISSTTADDYFQINKNGLGNNQSQTISSPISFMNESIWTFSGKEQISRPLTPPPQSPTRKIQQLIQQVQQQQKIDEYFSPTCAMIDVQLLGKGVFASQMKENKPIYQVQFKVNYKTDYFYILDDKERLKTNDMVVVEADRGYDIGKIISIIEKENRKKKKLISNDTVIKRIFRLANQTELLTLESRRQDEQKALFICQAKIKQKNLNMEVVEAEYQWDRRKLTFYFKANERIDFRELVRELFKIYKTRIWMCASSLDN